MRKFYLAFQKVHTLCEQLSWSHYRLLISVENEEARAYYLEEARKSLWSVRKLQRQINSFYYERLLDEKHCLSINPPNLPVAEAIFQYRLRSLSLRQNANSIILLDFIEILVYFSIKILRSNYV